MIYEDKYNLGLLAGKLSGSILEKDGAGINLPGKVALKFDKDILSQLAKTMSCCDYRDKWKNPDHCANRYSPRSFGPILTNPSGANMISGITTTFLRAKHSKANRPIAVLEIDEASLSRICDYIKPSLLVTNIFRDQMDRYGEIYTTYQMILDAIHKVPTATVLLNGDSPSL